MQALHASFQLESLLMILFDLTERARQACYQDSVLSVHVTQH